MNLERLRELLASGAITQEEFDNLSKDMTVETTVEPEAEPVADSKNEAELDELVEKRLQSKLDKALAPARKETALAKKEIAELKKQNERLRKQMMTEEEAKQLEFEEKQRELEEQRKELMIEKNKMYAVKAFKKAEMGDTEETLELVELFAVTCADETEIDEKVAVVKSWFEKSVKAEVDKRFKDNGYTPKKSDNLNNVKNPWAKGQESLTQQMLLESTNPEEAARLKALAGVI